MQPSPLANARILIADGDKVMLGLVHSILSGIGVKNVASVRDSDQAMEALRINRYDAMLLSDNIGPDPALYLVRSLRVNAGFLSRRTPIVLVADKAEVSYIKAARDAGVSEFIRKPISAKVVQLRLTSVLENPREFIAEPDADYAGPDRRRRVMLDIEETQDRRKTRRRRARA